MAMDWLKQLQNKTPYSPEKIGNIDVPDTPLSNQAADRMNQSISQYGPDMEKFFYGMMSQGGMQDVQPILDNMTSIGDRERQKTIAGMKSSGMPLRSTAMARATAGALSDADMRQMLAMNQTEMGAKERAMGRQFQGAQGMGAMPGYYSAPSSIEQAIFGMQTPYNMRNSQIEALNVGNQAQAYGMNQQNDMQTSQLMSQFLNQNWFQPERYVEQSGFNQYLAPFLTALMSGAGAAATGGIG